MKILFSFTLQGQSDVDNCLNRILDSKIQIQKCRFYYCDDFTRQYLISKKINEYQIIKSVGLSKELDTPLNVMRLSKNKPDYMIISIKDNTRITRFNEFEKLLNNFKGLNGKLNIFSTNFMYPYLIHDLNRIDSRVIFCQGIHKDILNEYVDTCEKLDNRYSDLINYPDGYNYTANDVLENMSLQYININYSGNKNQTLFQQFFLAHLSDY